MTTLNYPIIRVDEVLPWWMIFVRRPAPGPNTALVLTGPGQPNTVLTAGANPKLKPLAWRGYDAAHWVDLSERSLLLDCTLPTKIMGLDFQAAVYIAYKVQDPDEVVRLNMTNARAQIEEAAKRLMRERSRQWLLSESVEAETDIRDAINRNLRGGVIGVTRCFVAIDVEDEIREYVRKRRTTNRNYLHAVRNAEQTKELNKLDREIGQSMITFYNNLSHPGYAQFLLLHLASNRDQIQLVLGALNDQRKLDREHWLKMLETLRQNGALEASHWETLRNTVIERLLEAPVHPSGSGSTPVNPAGSGSGSSGSASIAGSSGGTP